MLTIIFSTIIVVWLFKNCFGKARLFLYIAPVGLGIVYGIILGDYIPPIPYYKLINEKEMVPIYYPMMEKSLAKYGYRTENLYGAYIENINIPYNDKKDFNRTVVSNKIDRMVSYSYVVKDEYDDWIKYKNYEYFQTPRRYYHIYSKHIIIMDCAYDFNHPRMVIYELYMFNPENKWNTWLRNWFTTRYMDVYYNETYWYIPLNSTRNNFTVMEKPFPVYGY